MADDWDFNVASSTPTSRSSFSFQHADDNPGPGGRASSLSPRRSEVRAGSRTGPGSGPPPKPTPDDGEFRTGSDALAVLEQAAEEFADDHRFSVKEGAMVTPGPGGDLSGLDAADGIFTPFFAARSGPLEFSGERVASVFKEVTNGGSVKGGPAPAVCVPPPIPLSLVCDKPAVCFGSVKPGKTGVIQIQLMLQRKVRRVADASQAVLPDATLRHMTFLTRLRVQMDSLPPVEFAGVRLSPKGEDGKVVFGVHGPDTFHMKPLLPVSIFLTFTPLTTRPCRGTLRILACPLGPLGTPGPHKVKYKIPLIAYCVAGDCPSPACAASTTPPPGPPPA